MLNDNPLSKADAQIAHEAAQSRTAEALESLEIARGNCQHSSSKLATIKTSLARYEEDLAAETQRAMDAPARSLDSELAANAINTLKTQIETTQRSLSIVQRELHSDRLAAAQAAVDHAHAVGQRADARIEVRRAEVAEAYGEFFIKVGGFVSCTGVGGIVRDAMAESVQAGRELSARKDELVGLIERGF
jgi:chromosome segregation ATPase